MGHPAESQGKDVRSTTSMIHNLTITWPTTWETSLTHHLEGRPAYQTDHLEGFTYPSPRRPTCSPDWPPGRPTCLPDRPPGRLHWHLTWKTHLLTYPSRGKTPLLTWPTTWKASLTLHLEGRPAHLTDHLEGFTDPSPGRPTCSPDRPPGRLHWPFTWKARLLTWPTTWKANSCMGSISPLLAFLSASSLFFWISSGLSLGACRVSTDSAAQGAEFD